MKYIILSKNFSLIIVFILSVVIGVCYFLWLDEQANKCISNGGKAIYNQFELFEKCIYGSDKE